MTEIQSEVSPETSPEPHAVPDLPPPLALDPADVAHQSEPLPTPAQSTPSEAAPATPDKARPKRFEQVAPVLEKLFELYPQLFGQRFLPLKLGVFQDLLGAHPTVFKRDMLKAALGVHTRSTRYLQAVANGLPRHDLQGQPVQDMAPEHVMMAIIELHARRQARNPQDLQPKLRAQMVHAYQSAGLSRTDYLARLPNLPEPMVRLLDEVMAQVDQQRARDAALIKAFEASGKTPEAFAESLGMPLAQVRAALKARPTSP